MIFGIVMILLGGFVAAMNWYAPIQSKRESRHVSMVPLVGAVLLGIGIYSISGSILWSLLAIPLDVGTLLLLIAIPWLVRELWETSSCNELAKFHAFDDGRDIYITLYKNGISEIRQAYNGTVGPQEHGVIPCSSGYSAKWQLKEGVFYLSDITAGREMKLIPDGDRYTSLETNVETDAEPHTLMDDLNFTQTKNQIPE